MNPIKLIVAGGTLLGMLVLVSCGMTTVDLTNIDYSKEFEHAVEAKVVAVQNAIAEKNRSVQVEERARQAVLTAEGDAKAKIVNSQAEAQSMKIRADALAQNPKLTEWEAVQKWNGQLPTYSMGGATPFINIPGK